MLELLEFDRLGEIICVAPNLLPERPRRQTVVDVDQLGIGEDRHVQLLVPIGSEPPDPRRDGELAGHEALDRDLVLGGQPADDAEVEIVGHLADRPGGLDAREAPLELGPHHVPAELHQAIGKLGMLGRQALGDVLPVGRLVKELRDRGARGGRLLGALGERAAAEHPLFEAGIGGEGGAEVGVPRHRHPGVGLAREVVEPGRDAHIALGARPVGHASQALGHVAGRELSRRHHVGVGQSNRRQGLGAGYLAPDRDLLGRERDQPRLGPQRAPTGHRTNVHPRRRRLVAQPAQQCALPPQRILPLDVARQLGGELGAVVRCDVGALGRAPYRLRLLGQVAAPGQHATQGIARRVADLAGRHAQGGEPLTRPIHGHVGRHVRRWFDAVEDCGEPPLPFGAAGIVDAGRDAWRWRRRSWRRGRGCGPRCAWWQRSGRINGPRRRYPRRLDGGPRRPGGHAWRFDGGPRRPGGHAWRFDDGPRRRGGRA